MIFKNNIDLHHFEKKDYYFIDLFYLSIIVYVFGFILFNLISPIYSQLIQGIALIFIFLNGFRIPYFKIESQYFIYIFVLLLLSNFLIILRFDFLNYENIKEYLFSEFQFWPFIVPILALATKAPFVFQKLFNWLYYLGIAFFIISLFLRNVYISSPIVAEQSIWLFSSGCGFILLTWRYHNLRRRMVAVLAIILALYISTILARRNIMLTNINFLLFSLFIYFFFNKGIYIKKTLILIFLLFLSFGVASFFLANKNTEFKKITNRFSEDTRGDVLDFYMADMVDNKWLGKGIDGTYFCPMVTEDEIITYRDLIESGYLQIILKGGLVNLIIFLLILLPAIFLGLFNSNNIFSKAAAILIFLWLIDMVPYGLPAISLRYIIVWLCVGICYTKSIRSMDESQVKRFLYPESVN